jgi:hypothetical protein
MSESLLLTRERVRPSRIWCRFERSSPGQVTLDPFKKPLTIPGGRDGFDTAIESQDSPDVRKKALASDAIEPRSPSLCNLRTRLNRPLAEEKNGSQRSSGCRFGGCTHSRAEGDGRAAANEVRPREGRSSRDRARGNHGGRVCVVRLKQLRIDQPRCAQPKCARSTRVRPPASGAGSRRDTSWGWQAPA